MAISAGGGMSEDDIALALGISRGTLRKHFQHELTVGKSQKRVEVMEALHKAALSGNVAACRAYAAGAAPREPGGSTGSEFAEPKGKKEQAAEAARTAQAGTEWADLLPSPSNLQ